MKTSTVISVAVAFSLTALLVYSLWTGLAGNKDAQTPSVLVGKPAPDFTLQSFEGEKVRLSDFRGKSLLLNFWASWCNPCKEEAPELAKAHMSFSNKRVEFIGINIMDDMKSAQKYIESFGEKFINVYDPENRIHLDYGIGGVPETFFINPDGIVTNRHRGPLTEKMITHYLRGAGAGTGK